MEFVKRAKEKFSDKLLSVVVFGSSARGTSDKESDIDLLIVAKDNKIKKELASLAFDMTLKYSEVFEMVVRTPEQIKYLIKLGSPFMDTIFKEGSIVYGTQTFKRTCGEGVGVSA